MKGHMEDGKFHPHKQYKSKSRKKRLDYNDPELIEAMGIKVKKPLVRKARAITKPKLIDVDIRRENWGFHSANGKIVGLELGNLSTAGFYWTGDADSINHFIVMMAGFHKPREFIDDMASAGVTLEMIKPQMLKNISGKLVDDKTDDGLYALTGGDRVWRFGDLPEVYVESELSGWDYFGDGKEFTKEEQKMIEDRFYNHYNDIGYEDFLKEQGEHFRNNFRKTIEEARDFEDLIDELQKDDRDYDNFEMYDEIRRPKINSALVESIKELQAEGKLRKNE